jgi:hypothetical protein
MRPFIISPTSILNAEIVSSYFLTNPKQAIYRQRAKTENMSEKLEQQKLKAFGIASILGAILYLLRKGIPILQNVHPAVFGFIFVIGACLLFNFLGQRQFGPTKRKKFNLSEQIPGLLIFSVVLLIVIGIATKSKVVLIIAFGSFLPVWFYLAISTYFKPLARTKKAIKEFSAKMGTQMIRQSRATARFSEIFYTDLGKIPFDHVTNIIEINPNFTIFCNTYSLPNPRTKGKYLPLENQLCFRFTIPPCSGYHRILLRNDMTTTAGGFSIATAGGSASFVKMNVPDIAENYIVLSKSESEIKKIISRILYELRKLVDILPNKGQIFLLDNIPANLDIHITRNEILARIPYQQGWLINPLYLSFKEIQSILSRQDDIV